MLPRLRTWDGSDVFAVTNCGRFWGCTLRVIEIARAQRWTNFKFVPFDIEHSLQCGWEGIDYLGKTWPPDSWYPKVLSFEEAFENCIAPKGRVRDRETAWAFLATGYYERTRDLTVAEFKRRKGDERRMLAWMLVRFWLKSDANVPKRVWQNVRVEFPDVVDANVPPNDP